MGLLSPYARTAIGALPDAGARGLALFAAAALLAASALSRAQEPTTRPAVPVADFFRTPMLARPTLSPNGRHLAGAVAAGSGRVRLAVLDLEPLGEPRAVAGFDDRDVDDIAWVNDRRLVFDTTDHQSGSSQFGSGLWAIDRDGSDQRQLIDLWYLSARPGMRTLPWTWRLHSVVADGSTDVLVQGVVLNNNEVVEISLARLDTKSGRSQNLSEGAPDHVFRWIVDRDGRPAAVTTLREGRFVAYLRSPSGSGWERWQDADAYAGNYAVPYAVAPDGQLLVLGRRPDSTAALFAVDPTTRRLKPEPMVRLDGYDFRGSLVYDRDERRLIGVHYVTDASGTAWLHPTMKAVQEAVNAKLPGTVNRIECERCLQAPTMLVSSYSDRQPPVFYSYNRDTRALTRIARLEAVDRRTSDGSPGRPPLRLARRTVDSGAGDPSSRHRRRCPTRGAAGARRAVAARHLLGLAAGGTVPRLTGLRGPGAGVPRQPGVRVLPLPRRVEAMGILDAGRPRGYG